MQPKITKTSSFRFEVSYPGHPVLKLDFELLHKAAQGLHPCDHYVFKHWQARPRDLRRFGLFSFFNGDSTYTCHAEAKSSSAIHYDLQIKETERIPSAVLYYPFAVQLDGKVIASLRRSSTADWTKTLKVGA